MRSRPGAQPSSPQRAYWGRPCEGCGYNLRGLTGDPVRCPECGLLNPRDPPPGAGVLIARAAGRINGQLFTATLGACGLIGGVVMVNIGIPKPIGAAAIALPLTLTLVQMIRALRRLGRRTPPWVVLGRYLCAATALVGTFAVVVFGSWGRPEICALKPVCLVATCGLWLWAYNGLMRFLRRQNAEDQYGYSLPPDAHEDDSRPEDRC